MNVVYAVSGAAIACTVGLAVYHELPPLAVENEMVAPKSSPEPLASHPVRTIPIVASPIVAPVITPLITPVITSPPPAAEDPPKHLARVSREPKPGGDVCARHGGVRVDDPARRTWRCVFPKRGAR